MACDEVDLVLFFRDPLKAETGSGSEQNLLRLCDMHSVPISTNIATAEVLLRGLDQATLTTVRASIPTSWSRCPSIGPCAEPVFIAVCVFNAQATSANCISQRCRFDRHYF